MKTILRKTQLIAVVWLFLIFQFISPEEFRIERTNSKDYFTIPQSKCNRNLDNCKPYFASNEGDPCRCFCADPRATFAFSKNSWACLENNATRSSFGVVANLAQLMSNCTHQTLENKFVSSPGCSKPTFFQNEVSSEPLTYFRADSQGTLSLSTNDRCQANLAASSFIDCNEKKAITLEETAITVRRNKRGHILQFDLPDVNPTAGSIINLSIRCHKVGSQVEDSCVLFKIDGTTYCNVTAPQTIQTTQETSSKNWIPKMTDTIGASPTEPSRTLVKQTVVFSPSVIALIVAINGSLVLTALVFGCSIYRRTRIQGHLTITRQNNEGRQPNARRPRLEDDSHYSYTGKYIPTPYAVSDLRHELPKSAHRPARNLKEDLKPNPSKSLYNYCPPEQHQDHIPISIDQRVYNIVEQLNSACPTSSHSYGSTNERLQSQPPVSVEQRVYGLVEELETPTRPGP